MPCINTQSLPRVNGKGAKDRITVSCGSCYSCLRKKQAEWSFRLSEELRHSTTAHFLTLSLADEHLTYGSGTDAILDKGQLQAFIKRLRGYAERNVPQYQNKKIVQQRALNEAKKTQKQQKTEITGKKIRYYAIGEYGEEFGRPHYHLIIFNLPTDPHTIVQKSWTSDKEPLGHIHIGDVTGASIEYVTKYVINSIEEQREVEPFAIMSLKPAIGKSYISRTGKWNKENEYNYVINQNGKKQSLPRYYKDKLFSYKQQEKIQLKSQEEIDKLETKGILKYGKNYFINLQTSQLQQEEKIHIKVKKSKL